jgi:hypothetical protein
MGLAVNPAFSAGSGNAQVVFGYAPKGGANPLYGIYSGIYSGPQIIGSTATQIVPPTYRAISSIQVANAGSFVYYVAQSNRSGNFELYGVPINGGAPTVFDSGDIGSASVETYYGYEITYDKTVSYPNGNSYQAIFVIPASNGATPVQLTNDAGSNFECPQFSKDNTQIVFISDKDDASGEVYTMNATNGSGIVKVTNNPTIGKMGNGVTFSADGTQTAYIGVDTSASGAATGVYTTASITPNSSSTLIVPDPNVWPGIYWTNFNGQARGGTTGYLVNRRRNKRLLP